MSKMKATDKQAMEILKKLDTLIGNSIDLDAEIESSEGIDEVLCCLEDTIDEFCETVELIEDIRAFLIELNEMDEEAPEDESECSNCCAPPELRNELIRIAEMAMEYERMAAAKRGRNAAESAVKLPEEDSVAMLFYDSEDYRVFPFEHVLRICPWVNEHSVLRGIPGLKDLFYLYEEGTEVTAGTGKYLVGPVVVIKLNEDHFLVTPDALDRHRVRKFMNDNTETVDFENGASYAALRFV